MIADSCISDHLDDPAAPTVNFMPFMTDAGSATVTGIVTNESLNPIEGVIVHVEGQPHYDTTDADGEYMLTGLKMGYCDISFTHDAYIDSTVFGLYAVIYDTMTVDMVLGEWTGCYYIVGDINGFGGYNGLDITFGVAFLKGGAPPPYPCDCPPHGTWYVAGDVNGSCSYNGLDITYGVDYFKGAITELYPCPDCPPAE